MWEGDAGGAVGWARDGWEGINTGLDVKREADGESMEAGEGSDAAVRSDVAS